MKALRTLIRLYINSIFRFPVIRYSKDPRERRNAVAGVVAIGTIVAVYGGMSGWLTFQLLSAGVDASIPFMMAAAMASLFTLAMAFAQGSATLSGFADFDTLMGMPIRTSVIVFARFCALYLAEAIYAAAYLLPCGAVYAILRAPAWWFYPAFPLMTLLLPVAPIVIGSGADLLLSAAFARSKYKKGITSAIKMIFLFGFIVFSYLLPRVTDRFLAAPADAAMRTAKIYPPVMWFAKGAAGDVPLALLFTLGSIAVCALFVFVLNKTFLPLHDRMSAGYHVRNYRLGALKRSGALKAMFTVERKRFFNSTAWVVNTVFGSALIALLGIAGAALSGKISAFLRTTPLADHVAEAITGILLFCATLSPTTSCAISMEGKQIWIAKTLPVSAKTWFAAKLLLNLVLVGPSLLFTVTMLAIFYRGFLTPLSILGLYLLPIAALLFTTVLGLFVNAKLPRLSWKSDTEVVKQSGAVLVMMLICFGLVVISVLPMLAIGSDWVAIAVSAAILAGAIGVYLYLRDRAEQFRRNL
jgi:ABC-2 type transport system permease protein